MKYLVRLSGVLIDVTASFFIYQIAALPVAYFEYIPPVEGFFFTWAGYYIVCYLAWRRTLGQTVINYGIHDSGNKRSYPIRIVLRECLTSFPAIVILTFGGNHLAILRSLLLLLICGILTALRKRLFRISIVKKERPSASGRRAVVTYMLILVAALFARVDNTISTCNSTAAGQSAAYAVPRPSAHSVKAYTDFLNDNRQEINDYVMGLFDRYDHVIICERAHREMTQYDMIYNLVTDKRFVDKVGHVFTEIGNAESRDAYKTFVDTEFANDSSVEKGLSAFMTENQSVHLLWPNTNWFEFLKKMYYFNHGRDKKVEILFTDRNWIDRSELDFRDSIMADNIINTLIPDSIEKSLIIMNYRHAYLTPGNCGHYVERKFPGKVANVMINTGRASFPALMMGHEVLVPIRHGKWDVAFEQISDRDFAFDFKGSPFGKDPFDHFVMPWNQANTRRYEEMFTGFIFYEGADKQFTSIGYPHIFDAENLQKLRLREASTGDYSLDYWIETLKDGIRCENGADLYYDYYIIENKIYSGVLVLSLLLLCIAVPLSRRRSLRDNMM